VKKMPSANQVEIDTPLREEISNHGADLHSLLREFRDSNVSHLNSLLGRGKVLFAEGEPARGIYLLRSGRASISISSRDGRVVILRLAQAGDVLGLNSALRNSSYDATVKTLEPCRIDFISRVELLELMQRSESSAHAILKILSHELTQLTERARLLLLPQTVSAKLARLLLEWSKTPDGDTSSGVRIDRVFTQEEIAQMICTSRETVTRLFASLSRRQIIHISSDSLLIRDRVALEEMALS
jgi:CRP/FNR family transcriptional regulator